MADLSRLCIHTITTKPWPIETAIDRFAAAGAAGITVWRDTLEGRDPKAVGRAARDAGLEVTSLCRGGFFPSRDLSMRNQALDDNRRAIEEAADLGAGLIVLVCGADPKQDLAVSRAQIVEALGILAPEAEAAGVKLGVEPLHPMYADTRSAINTLTEANDVCAEVDHPAVGVVVDVYHLWWDPRLAAETRRSGREGRLLAFHVCDWRVPTEDMLNDRGLMGDGCIPVGTIREVVEETGFAGLFEVEVFSHRYWSEDQDDYLQRIVAAFRTHV
jgi:sugar phosphate isomerase/epimerase